MVLITHSYPDLDPRDAAALKDCIDRSYVGWDKDLDEDLRKNIRKFVCKDHVVLMPSGSMALLVALKALGVKPDDEVLMPAIDCWSVYNAIQFLGARPVICDVRLRNDLRADFESMAQHITKNVKVVIVTHMFGVLIEEEVIKRLKEEFKVFVIEDYASSFGALYNDSLPVGRYADFIIGSFGATKPITAGCGGFIAGHKPFLTEGHHQPKEGMTAINYDISSLNQCLLAGQFARLEKMLAKKRKLKELFTRFVKIWGAESQGLYRAITFDNTVKLKDFFQEQGYQLDTRDSAQPNLARALNLELPNARHFQSYCSLPFHAQFAKQLELKGLLP